LNGIIYTEIPWVLANPSSAHRYPRLYALGYDSLLVAQNLNKLKRGSVVNGKTGTIRYSRSGSLHRTLQWATFRNGRPVVYVP
jgi:outer membrane PBP1 activator LpoA protein